MLILAEHLFRSSEVSVISTSAGGQRKRYCRFGEEPCGGPVEFLDSVLF